MSRELFEAVDRLIHDEAFRAEFLFAPAKHLSELGVSPELVERLAPTVVAALIAGGLALHGQPPGIDDMGWR